MSAWLDRPLPTTRRARHATALLCLLGLLSGLWAVHGASGAESWSVRRFDPTLGTALRWANERGAIDGYFAVDAQADTIGLLRTSDAGRTWSPLTPAPPLPGAAFGRLFSMARDRDTAKDLLIATTGFESYRRSTTTGAWRLWGPPGEGPISGVAPLAGRAALVARAGGNRANLFRTTNEGAAWSTIATPTNVGTIVDLSAFDAGAIWLRDAGGQIWRTDSTDFASAAPFRARLLEVEGDSIALALDSGFALRRTTDAGGNWETIASPATLHPEWRTEFERAHRIGREADGFLWIACRDLVVGSDDGATWTELLRGSGIAAAFAVNGASGEFLAGGAGVWGSRDRGASWDLASGHQLAEVAYLSPNTLMALRPQVVMSPDGGGRWERAEFSSPADSLGWIVSFGGSAFVTRSARSGTSLFVSANRGRTWNTAIGAPRGIRDLALGGAALFWCASEEGVAQSTDGGLHWEALAGAPFDQADLVWLSSDSLGWVAGGNRLHVTSDRGARWTSHDLPESGIDDLLFVDADSGFAAGQALYRTSDRGRNWAPIPGTDRARGRWRRLVKPAAAELWASGDRGALAHSIDGWSFTLDDASLEVNDPAANLTSLSFLGESDGVSGSGAALWRYADDREGPRYRLEVVPHPYLEHTLHLYISAREQLLGDSLRVSIGAESWTLRAAADRFLHHLTFTAPNVGSVRTITVSGSDLAGNRRSASFPFSAGRGAIRYQDGDLDLRLSAPGRDLIVTRAELEPGELPPADQSSGRPFRLRARSAGPGGAGEGGGGGNISARWHDEAGSTFLLRGAGDWELIDGRALLALAEERPVVAAAANGSRPNPVRELAVWPNPATTEVTLRPPWPGPVTARLFDVTGRERLRREWSGTTAKLSWSLPELPAGRYWIELRPSDRPSRVARGAVTLLSRDRHAVSNRGQ
ncbi:MAG: hypothetical protein IT349_09380 [Candidatus Eisenbacteria bacterium]|nr:hypothetical protein [Candidatus Eisenbacteria bacterium]